MANLKGQALVRNIILKDIIEPTIDKLTGLDISSDSDKNDKSRKGKIYSVGVDTPKDDKGNYVVNVGDLVLYNKHQTSNLTIEGEKYLCLAYIDLIYKL
jgi:co-chaperonin GroES (HSP10)